MNDLFPSAPDFKRRIPQLDGFRGFALLMVLFYHYVEPGEIPRYLSAFGRMNWSSMDLFFVLSGFLIGGILIDARTSSNFFQAFYVRRVCRVLPLYIFVLLVFLVCFNLSSGSQHPAMLWLFYRPLPWCIYSTLTQNFWTAYHGTLGAPFLGPTWSIPVEEQFYIAVPFLIRFVKPARLPYWLASAILMAPILRTVLYLYSPYGGWAAFVLMPCRADALLLGVSAALVVRSQKSWLWLVEHRRAMKVILGLLFIGMVWAGHKKWANVSSFATSSFGYTWVALFYVFILLILVSQPANLLTHFFQNRFLRGLGKISYSAYLFHIAVVAYCYAALRSRLPHPVDFGDFAATGLAFGITLGLATLSWLFFEKPILKIGHRYKFREANKQANL